MDEKKMVESLMQEKEALTAVVKEMDGELAEYKDLGTTAEITEALDKSKALAETVSGFDLTSLQEDIEELAEYRELGSVEQISRALDKSMEVLATYKELGTPEKLSEAIDRAHELLTEYKELGTPEEISKALDIFGNTVVTEKCEAVAAKYNYKADTVRSMYDRVEDFEVVEALLKDTTGHRVEDTDDTDLNEDRKPITSKDLSSSAIRRVSRNLM